MSKIENPERAVMPELNELTFEDKSHTYRLDGFVVPSVTTVMKPLSAEKYNSIPKFVLDKAADRGTAVHAAIEEFLKYGIDDFFGENRPYFDAFLKWYELNTPELVASESKVYHKVMGYAGTIDCICYINGVLTMIDFKTTTSIIDMTCQVQLEAYAKALETHGIFVEDKMILRIDKNGNFEERHYPAKDGKSWQVFTSLKILYDYLSQYQ